jgi:hypothetical protein
MLDSSFDGVGYLELAKMDSIVELLNSHRKKTPGRYAVLSDEWY